MLEWWGSWIPNVLAVVGGVCEDLREELVGDGGGVDAPHNEDVDRDEDWHCDFIGPETTSTAEQKAGEVGRNGSEGEGCCDNNIVLRLRAVLEVHEHLNNGGEWGRTSLLRY